MKTHSTTAGTPIWAQLQHAIGNIATGIGHSASRVRKGVSNLMVQMQIARMQSVLQAMTDAQLDQIGITRSGIRKHAEHLVTYEYDGL